MGEILTILSVISFLAAGVLGMAAVVLWLQTDIPGIMRGRTGRAAKRSAKRMNKADRRMAGDMTEQLEDIMIVHTDEVLGKGEEDK